jgi:simple sugar transport system permease protein
MLSRLKKSEGLKTLVIALLAILLSLVAISIVILLIGKNPLTAFRSLLQGSGWLPRGSYSSGSGQIADFFYMIDSFTPMLFAALAVAVAFRCGLFNIGISGQMLLAGFIATITVGYSSLPSVVSFPLILLIGAGVGASAGGLIGFLKYRFNINEVVSSIMLNYTFQYIIAFFINTKYVDTISRQSKAINAQTRLTLTDVQLGSYHVRIAWCVVLAVAAAVVIWLFFKKTKQGFEIRAVGLNRKSAEYAGIRVGANIIFAMVLSGALAGLAGVTYYLGYFNSIQPGTLPSYGFDAIATAFLGNSHPLGIIAASLLITCLSRGSNYMSSMADVRVEVSSLITGMILLFSACSAYIRYRYDNRSKNKGGETL